MEYLIPFAYFSVLILLLKNWKWMKSPFLNGWSIPLFFTLHTIASLFLFHSDIAYLGDSPVFLRESKILASVFYTHPRDYLRLLTGIGENQEIIYSYLRETIHWTQQPDNVFNDSKNLMRFNSILQLFSFGNDYANLILVNFISIIGLNGAYQAFRTIIRQHSLFFEGLFFLLPSFILWTSAILKEPYMILGFGLFLYGWLGKGENTKHRWGTLLTGVLFLLAIKPYVLLCLIPAVIAKFIYEISTKRKLFYALGTVLLIAILGWAATLLLPRNLTFMISKKQHNFLNLTEGGIWILTDSGMVRVPKTEEHKFTFFIEHSNRYGYLNEPTVGETRRDGEIPREVQLVPDSTKLYIFHLLEPSGSRINITPINQSHLQLIQNIPQALFNALLRPLPKDPPDKKEKWYFIFENIFLYALIAFALFKNTGKIQEEHKSSILGFTIFILSISLLIGWITPVIGAIIRYKLPVVIALIGTGWLLLYKNQVTER